LFREKTLKAAHFLLFWVDKEWVNFLFDFHWFLRNSKLCWFCQKLPFWIKNEENALETAALAPIVANFCWAVFCFL
jgi:hypothetical protein